MSKTDQTSSLLFEKIGEMRFKSEYLLTNIPDVTLIFLLFIVPHLDIFFCFVRCTVWVEIYNHAAVFGIFENLN